MITDKITRALITYISDTITDIPVVNGEKFDETVLPCIVVKVESNSKHSLTLNQVSLISMSVTLVNHIGDTKNRDDIEDLTDDLETLLSDPFQLKIDINDIIDDGVCVDFIQFNSGVPDWNENVLLCVFEGECYAQKGTIV